ncbi:imm11 family protein [Pyxidicoccus sp. 3LG]
MRFFMIETLGNINDRSLCVIHSFVKGIEMSAWKVGEGERVGEEYPQDAKIYMSKESPGIKLSDVLGTVRNMLIVSSRFRALIEKHCTNDIEYLPFTLYDHRKRVYSQDYSIINPIGTFDCLDIKASTIIWGTSDPTRISSVHRRVLDRKRLENAPQLFRIDKSPSSYVVRLELAKDMNSLKLSNAYWSELAINDGSRLP